MFLLDRPFPYWWLPRIAPSQRWRAALRASLRQHRKASQRPSLSRLSDEWLLEHEIERAKRGGS